MRLFHVQQQNLPVHKLLSDFLTFSLLYPLLFPNNPSLSEHNPRLLEENRPL